MTVKIATTRFGEIEIDRDAIISIPGGLIGFAGQEQYAVIRHDPKSPFFWLQSLDLPDLAFVIVDPFIFKPDYEVKLPQAVQDSLGLKTPADIKTYVLVTIPHGRPQNMTANLLGPLIVNLSARKARQIILDDSLYSHKHPMLARGEGKTSE